MGRTALGNLNDASLVQIFKQLKATNMASLKTAVPTKRMRSISSHPQIRRQARTELKTRIKRIKQKISSATKKKEETKKDLKEGKALMTKEYKLIQKAKEEGGFLRKMKNGTLSPSKLTPTQKRIYELSKEKEYQMSPSKFKEFIKSETKVLEKYIQESRNYIANMKKFETKYKKGLSSI